MYGKNKIKRNRKRKSYGSSENSVDDGVPNQESDEGV